MFSRTLEAEHGKMPPPKARAAVHESFAQYFWKCCFGSFSLFKVFTYKKVIPSLRVWKDDFVFLSLFGARIE